MLNVLIVDDEPNIVELVRITLEDNRVRVTHAGDGLGALALAQMAVPDLILLDLLMPRLPGIEVLRALKADAATKGIPVLVLSNSSREQDVAEVMELGAVDYWVKANLSLKELSERVVRLLGA